MFEKMPHYVQQDCQQCMIYVAAMILRWTPDAVIKALGRTGEEPVSSGGLRGIHIQEIQDLFLTEKMILGLVQIRPALPSGQILTLDTVIYARLLRWLLHHEAILIVQPDRGLRHAVAWDGVMALDPNGGVYGLDALITRMPIVEAWVVGRLESNQN